MSTHNICFCGDIRKISVPLKVPYSSKIDIFIQGSFNKLIYM